MPPTPSSMAKFGPPAFRILIFPLRGFHDPEFPPRMSRKQTARVSTRATNPVKEIPPGVTDFAATTNSITTATPSGKRVDVLEGQLPL